MRSSFARHIGCALGLTLLCLGTTVAAQEQEDRNLHLQTPARDSSLQVSPGSIVGPDVRLVRDEAAVRGRAFGRSVFLQIRPGTVEGTLGAQPMWLTWREKEGTLLLEGSLIGSPVGLEVGPERLTGSVGPCVYDLESQDEAYTGVRVCGTGDPQRVSVSLPSRLPVRGSPMLATALALLLGM